MRIKSTAIQDNSVFKVQTGGKGRPEAVVREGPAAQGRLETEFRPTQQTFSLTRWVLAALIGVAVACPASAQETWGPFDRTPADPIEQGKIDAANDPAEEINREIFQFNKFLDDNILKPAARAYTEGLSPELRKSIHNFVTNAGEPLVFANDVLQGNAGRAWNTTQRFAVNSTIGVAGFVDVAGSWGREYHYADLGQTFGVWGMGPGPIVQIPFLGPSNLRDSFGLAATNAGFFFLPGTAGNVISYTETGVTVVDDVDYRASLLPNTDALEKSSKDLYESIRLIKAQWRAKLVEDGKAGFVSREAAINAETPGH